MCCIQISVMLQISFRHRAITAVHEFTNQDSHVLFVCEFVFVCVHAFVCVLCVCVVCPRPRKHEVYFSLSLILDVSPSFTVSYNKFVLINVAAESWVYDDISMTKSDVHKQAMLTAL